MSGFVTETAETVARLRGMVDVLAARVNALERGKRFAADPAPVIPTGRTLLSESVSQEEWLFVRISGRNLPGQYSARVQSFDRATGGLINDPDYPSPIDVWGFGKGPFPAAYGFARYCGYYEPSGFYRPMYIMGAGEWDGFLAKLDTAPDATHRYHFTQTEIPVWHTPHSGHAYPRGAAAYDTNITLRKIYPMNTIVRVWCEPASGLYFFDSAADPDYGLC